MMLLELSHIADIWGRNVTCDKNKHVAASRSLLDAKMKAENLKKIYRLWDIFGQPAKNGSYSTV